jgi:hypothetical protein
MYDDVLKVSETLKFRYPLFYEVYSEGKLLAKVMKVKAENLPQYVLADPNMTRFVPVPVSSPPDLQNWMDQLDIATVKWQGGEKAPGIGLLVELGGWPVYIIGGCLTLVILAVAWVIWDAARTTVMEERENRKEE